MESTANHVSDQKTRSIEVNDSAICRVVTADIDCLTREIQQNVTEVHLGMADQSRGFEWPHVEPLMTMHGLINGMKTKKPILIDSGASSNFVSADFVHKNRLSTRGLKQAFKVSLADGRPMSSVSTLDHARVQLPTADDYDGRHQFMVLDRLPGYDAVLGRPFLIRAGAIVDHNTDKIEWRKQVKTSRSDTMCWRTGPSNPASSTDCLTQNHSPDATLCATSQSSCLSSQPQGRTSTAIHREADQTLRPAHAVGDENQRRLLNEELDAYRDSMKSIKGKLPPCREGYDHTINEKADAKPVKLPPIRQRPELARAMKEKLDSLLDDGLIRKSISPYGAPAFMVEQTATQGSQTVKKQRLVVNFKGLNEQTETNATSLPHIDELIARLSKAKVFSKLDLTSGFHQVRMKEEDIPKTAFTTPFGHFEWVVMPFGEKNAPATFVQLLNQLVLVDLVHDYVIVFVDDILVFSENPDIHIEHVRAVLDRLAKHKLFINPDKCEWMVDEIDFLGYRLRAGDNAVEMMIQDNKIAAIMNWPAPTTISQLRSFLGAANFSRAFVQDFSSIARPLTEATAGKHASKTTKITWGEDEQRAFEQLKNALTTAPSLAVPDESKPFVLHTDASDFGIGASLSQWNEEKQALQVCGYMSAKLKGAELNWTTHDKEMYALVRAIENWTMHFVQARHPIKVYTDNKALKDMLKGDMDISGRRSRWTNVLTRFDLDPQSIEGSKNVLADGLSRRPDLDGGKEEVQAVRRAQADEALKHLGLTVLTAHYDETGSSICTNLLESIRKAYDEDQECLKILRDPRRYHMTVDDRLIVDENGLILVPSSPAIRTTIISESHDIIVSGHLGIAKTVMRVRERFTWDGLVADVHAFVKSCVQCQANKSRTVGEAGLLQPIAPPMTKGLSITIDFVGPLPRTARRKDFIMVMVDRFSKRVWYEPTTQKVNAKQAARILFDRVVRHQGLPEVIISDRDPRFKARMWRALWKECGTRLAMTVSFRARANGLTETNNRVMQDMLRSFVSESRKDWDLKLSALEIAYNSSVNETTGMTPFQLDIGMQPRLPIHIAANENREQSGSTSQFLADWEENWALAHESIRHAQKKQMIQANSSRRDEQYRVGDLAWVRLDRGTLSDGIGAIEKLGPRLEGPYEITELHGANNVTLKLNRGDRRHNKFNVDQLRPFVARDSERFPSADESPSNNDEASEDDEDEDLVHVDDQATTNADHVEHAESSVTRPKRIRKQIDHGVYVKH